MDGSGGAGLTAPGRPGGGVGLTVPGVLGVVDGGRGCMGRDVDFRVPAGLEVASV
ncbi:hypothetical protein RKD20_001923 [Streptomyces sp. SLBN-8D4]|jgi:hypothetical protein